LKFIKFEFSIYDQYQCKSINRNDLQCVDGDVKPYSLTHSLTDACALT